MEQKKALLIAFEGIDGTGKTTLAQMLKERLEALGHSVVMFKEPTNETEAGKKIRASYVEGRASLDIELQWFIEDREWNVTTRILPALAENKIVFLDRYFFSTACYQGVRKNNDWFSILELNRKKFPEPDLTIIFDLDVQLAVKRIMRERSNANTFEGMQNLRDVRALFLEMFQLDTIGNYLLINAEKSIEEILELLYAKLLELINKTPLKESSSKEEEKQEK
ncbi:MAG: dTMP kinase [Candidatus Heimdallarchaeota archaeon]|nr:dTMP kinase [Candidatus Heimdallarchaeota archaeon]MCK4289837.1 dTMP kinase [Candidatus Heimdallarchaeota archaeon]